MKSLRWGYSRFRRCIPYFWVIGFTLSLFSAAISIGDLFAQPLQELQSFCQVRLNLPSLSSWGLPAGASWPDFKTQFKKASDESANCSSGALIW